MVGTLDSHSRESGSNHLAAVSKLEINEYLAIDNGGYENDFTQQ